MDMARVIKVIESTIGRRGDGNKTPIRIIIQYFDTEGNLLAEVDPSPDWEREIKQLRNAVKWALGENGEFPERKENEGNFWWRKNLRNIAGL